MRPKAMRTFRVPSAVALREGLEGDRREEAMQVADHRFVCALLGAQPYLGARRSSRST